MVCLSRLSRLLWLAAVDALGVLPCRTWQRLTPPNGPLAVSVGRWRCTQAATTPSCDNTKLRQCHMVLHLLRFCAPLPNGDRGQLSPFLCR